MTRKDKSVAQRLAAVGLGYRYDGHPRGNLIFVAATGEELGRFHVQDAIEKVLLPREKQSAPWSRASQRSTQPSPAKGSPRPRCRPALASAVDAPAVAS